MSYIERLEVPAGWLNISCPELTAVDMVAYQESTSIEDAEVDKKWKVMVNQEIEIYD